MAFKTAKPITGVTFNNSQFVYIWDDTDKKNITFKKVLKNFQDEINNFNGSDLKSLYEKNIIPNNNKPAVYIDETIFSGLDNSKLYDLSQLEISFIDEETGEVIKGGNKDENKTTEPINKSSTELNTKTASVPREKE